jgi:hypothetical protein
VKLHPANIHPADLAVPRCRIGILKKGVFKKLGD